MTKVKLTLCIFAIAASGFSMDLVVSPASMDWLDQGFVEFSISNLTVGAEVELTAFVDLNGNSVVDGNDPFIAQFELEDGLTNVFGAVTLVDDNDGTTNGMINATISFYGNSRLHTLGDYIWKATELDGSGSPVATNWAGFSVTQLPSAIRVNGEVRDHVTSNTVAGAYVELEYFSDLTGLSPSTWADENGAFSICLPSGISSNEVLGVYAAAAGYMSSSEDPDGNLISIVVFTNGLATGTNTLVRPLLVVSSSPSYNLYDITGTVYLIEPADGGGVETNALSGAMVEIEYPSFGDEDDGDTSSFDVSDTNGTFSLVFSAAEDEWDSATLSCDTSLLNLRGIVSSPVQITITGSTNGIALYCTPAEALVSGTVTDLTTTNPISGMEVDLILWNDDAGMAYTLSNGTYEVGASAGTYGIQCDGDLLALKRYVYNSDAGYLYLENLSQGEVRSDQDLAYEKGMILSGHVYSESGSPLGGGDAILVQPSEDDWEYRIGDSIVAFDGHYNLLAPAGTWTVRTENEDGAWIDLYYANCLIGNSAQATPIVVSNAPISGIDFYLTAGTRLQGSVLTADAFAASDVQMGAFRLDGSGQLDLVGTGITDRDAGAFNFVVPSGSNIYLRANSDGFQTPDTWYGDVGSHNLATPILPILGTTQSNLNIQILAGYQVEVTALDQFDLSLISDITIAAFDAASNQYGSAVYQWGAWNIFVPTNTPLTFFADAAGYEGEFITNTYIFADAGYIQRAANNYVHLELVLHSSSLDSDNDGLPDYLEDSVPDNEFWPEDYSNPKNPDTDQDGVGDYQEYVAGTDARNGGSIFKITDAIPSGTGLTLWWSSVPGREYTVQLCPDLIEGSWSNIHTVVASSSETSYAPEATASNDYYRIQVVAP